jgi:glycosyltransferase involved in cell wall biosynthesis
MSRGEPAPNFVIVQGTPLPSTYAHWVQIIHTAHALARQPGVEVWVLTTALFRPADEILRQYGLEPLPTLHLIPLSLASLHRWHRFGRDVFAPSMNRLGRALARRTFGRLMKRLAAGGRRTVILTREQGLHRVFGDLLPRGPLTLINEHHRFASTDALRRFMADESHRRRALSDLKRIYRKERGEERRRLEQFDGIICTTQPIQAHIRRLGHAGPTIWLPNGARLEERGASGGGGEERTIEILYAGQLYAWKNVDLLVEAMALLPGRKLTIVGGNDPGDVERLRVLARRVGVLDQVIFLGQRPHAEVGEVMRRARVGVIPLPRAGAPETRFHSCPLKAFELMAAGTPIVSSRLPTLRGVLEDGETAVLVRPDSREALAEGIDRVLRDSALWRRLSENGLRAVRQFTYDERARRILEFVGQCSTR